MLTTPTDIINAACSLIGEDPIQDFSDETQGGQAANAIYDMTVDFNLSLTPFSFAERMVQCSQISDAAPFTGYKFRYDVPGDWLGPPLFVTDSATDPYRRYTAYLLSEQQIHCDADILFVMQRFRPEPHLWSASFRSATINAVAAQLALALASDTKMGDYYNSLAYGTPSENFRGGQMRIAIYEDARATPPRRIDVNQAPLLRDRRDPFTFGSR